MSLLEQLLSDGEDITLFGDSQTYVSPEYTKQQQEVFALYQRLVMRFGPKIEEMLDEYTEAVETKEDFVAEHYFEQGFLVGQRQIKRERDLT